MFLKKLIGSALLISTFLATSNPFAYATPPSSPEWAKKVVWYQIFPERFYNGDKANDPDVGSLKGSWPHDYKSDWQVSPWTSAWYQLQPWEKKNSKDIWFNIQRRRYGGDLEGIIKKLDYIKDLGIGGLYINPVFYAPSSHKYDQVCYHHIDIHFGPDPKGDLELMKKEKPNDPSTWVWTSADKTVLELIKQAHKRGIKVIFDGVFNHMGINSFAFQDIVTNGKKSEFVDWFTITDWDKPGNLGIPFKYDGWFGVNELPELKEDAKGIVAGPKKYIFDITRRWMSPDGNLKDGIDGWRLDVAFCVGHNFWKDWRKHVKSINPDAYITAEIIDKPEVVKPYILGDEFDAAMNYNFAFISSDYFVNDKLKIKTSEFDKKLTDLVSYFGDASYVMQNLYDSHDTQRILSGIINSDLGVFGEWGAFFDLSKGSNPKYKVNGPDKLHLDKLKLMAAFQMTSLGAPMIYYGDEAGMWGGNDPCCRKPMVWEEFKYDNEDVMPDQSVCKISSPVKFDKNLHDHYKKMINFRNEHVALQLGTSKSFLIDDSRNLYGFIREYGKDKVVVILNNSAENVKYDLDAKYLDNKKDIYEIWGNKTLNLNKNVYKLDLPPYSAAILK